MRTAAPTRICMLGIGAGCAGYVCCIISASRSCQKKYLGGYGPGRIRCGRRHGRVRAVRRPPTASESRRRRMCESTPSQFPSRHNLMRGDARVDFAQQALGEVSTSVHPAIGPDELLHCHSAHIIGMVSVRVQHDNREREYVGRLFRSQRRPFVNVVILRHPIGAKPGADSANVISAEHEDAAHGSMRANRPDPGRFPLCRI